MSIQFSVPCLYNFSNGALAQKYIFFLMLQNPAFNLQNKLNSNCFKSIFTFEIVFNEIPTDLVKRICSCRIHVMLFVDSIFRNPTCYCDF
jgi:hypothetical protein